MPHVVTPGQSLWSISRSLLGPAASDAQVQQGVVALAEQNGLAPDAKLRVGQELAIPDRFVRDDGQPSSFADARARLGTTTSGAAGMHARLSHSAKPVVALDATFSDTRRTPAGAVELHDVAGVKPSGTKVKLEGVKTQLGESALYSVEAQLGRLTREQFDAVKAELGGRSQLTFDPAREYAVADFLPSALQALLHKDLEVPEPVTLKGTKKVGYRMDETELKVDLTMNCHATAWEAARAYQGANERSVAVFYGEMITMDEVVDPSRGFQLLGEKPAAELASLFELGLKPGDIVQFHEVSDWVRMTMLLHSAVYVGGGLFFEKPNTEGPEKEDRARYVLQEETPFRLVTLDMMTAPIAEATDGKLRVEVFRPTEPMPDAKEVFGSSLQEDLEKWAKKKGRTLGAELVVSLEQGMGGNIRGEHVSALVRVPLAQNDDGRAKLDV